MNNNGDPRWKEYMYLAEYSSKRMYSCLHCLTCDRHVVDCLDNACKIASWADDCRDPIMCAFDKELDG